jgi:hypothetical protein
MTCPRCGGTRFVFYEGTTGPYGDDPDDMVECPVCSGREPDEVCDDWDDVECPVDENGWQVGDDMFEPYDEVDDGDE